MVETTNINLTVVREETSTSVKASFFGTSFNKPEAALTAVD